MSGLVTYSIKLPRELRERMREVDIDWAEYLRSVIRAKVEEEERRRASRELDAIRSRAGRVSTDELVSWVRGDRSRQLE